MGNCAMTFETARRHLESWRSEFPADPYEADDVLRALLARAVPADRLAALAASASAFGRDVVNVVGPSATRYEHRAHLPELDRYDSIGRRIEQLSFDPEYHTAGAVVWGSGLVAHSGEPGRAFEQATLL